MSDIVITVPWLHTIIVVCVVIGIVGTAWRMLAKTLVPVVKRISAFLEDWDGREGRPGVDRQPGVMEQLKELRTQMDRANHQLWENNGSSLKDSVNRTEEKLDRAETKLDEHINWSKEQTEYGKQAEKELRAAVKDLASAVNKQADELGGEKDE